MLRTSPRLQSVLRLSSLLCVTGLLLTACGGAMESDPGLGAIHSSSSSPSSSSSSSSSRGALAQLQTPTAPRGSKIAAGLHHSLAVTADGMVVPWGIGPRPTPATTQSDVVAVAAGDYHSLALKTNGEVVAWAEYSGTVPAAAKSGVVAISAGYTHNLALKANGQVVAWGLANDYGETNVPPAAQSGVAAVCAGRYSSFALKTDGTLVAWGRVAAVPAEAQSGVIAITTTSSQGTWVLKADGTLVGWESNGTLITADAPMGSRMVAVSGGVALTNTGAVVVLDNSGDFLQHRIPLESQSGVIAVSAGHNQILALKTDGSIVAWGYNGDGQTNVPKGLNLLAMPSGQ